MGFLKVCGVVDRLRIGRHIVALTLRRGTTATDLNLAAAQIFPQGGGEPVFFSGSLRRTGCFLLGAGRVSGLCHSGRF
jgi:hypothetical protein